MKAIDMIYNQLMEVFGGSNPNQMFTMLMPGTVLDPAQYTFNTSRIKPATVVEAESKLVDQMFDVAQVQASSNGRRVSQQYKQALSVLVPSFNRMMPEMKQTLRDFINQPMPPESDFKGSVRDYYFKLLGEWIAEKEAWEREIFKEKKSLSDPNTEREEYLEWYEEQAESALLKIDAALAKVVSVFSPTDMNAIICALAAGPGGEVSEAYDRVADIGVPSPSGGTIYPVDMLPTDWFLGLASEIHPVDLLKDPEFIAKSIAVKRRALQTSIDQINAMIAQIPSQSDIAAKSAEFKSAQDDYSKAQSELTQNYGDNILAAVDLFLTANPGSKAAGIVVKEVQSVKKLEEKVAQASGASAATGKAIGHDEVKTIVNGLQKMQEAQDNMLAKSQVFTDAIQNLELVKSQQFKDLPLFLGRLQSQLRDIGDLRTQLNSAIAGADRRTEVTTAKICDEETKNAMDEFVSKAAAAADADTAMTDVKSAIDAKAAASNGSDEKTRQARKAILDELKNAVVGFPQAILKRRFEAFEVQIEQDLQDVLNKVRGAQTAFAAAESIEKYARPPTSTLSQVELEKDVKGAAMKGVAAVLKAKVATGTNIEANQNKVVNEFVASKKSVSEILQAVKDYEAAKAAQSPPITGLTTCPVGAFDTSGITALTTSAIVALTTFDVTALTTSGITGFTTSAIGSLTTFDVTALTTSAIAALETAAIQALITADIGSLSSAVSASSSHEVIAALEGEIASLKDKKRQMLKTIQDEVENKFVGEAVQHIRDYQGKSTLTSGALQALAESVGKLTAKDISQAVSDYSAQFAVAGGTSKRSETSSRFMEFQFSFSSSDMASDSSASSSASRSDWSVNFFLGAASGSHSATQAASQKYSFEQNTAIQIGFKAMKVDVLRGWMDPGVFMLSEDMNRLSTLPVSRGRPQKDQEIDELNEALFPCFPVSFVLVKDVTLTFEVSENSLAAFQSLLDQKAVSGGGFLCFRASTSSSSHSESSSMRSRSKGRAFTIRMPAPQILGWFLEFTPKDSSMPLTANELANGDLSIISFVNKLKEVGDAKHKPQGG